MGTAGRAPLLPTHSPVQQVGGGGADLAGGARPLSGGVQRGGARRCPRFPNFPRGSRGCGAAPSPPFPSLPFPTAPGARQVGAGRPRYRARRGPRPSRGGAPGTRPSPCSERGEAREAAATPPSRASLPGRGCLRYARALVGERESPARWLFLRNHAKQKKSVKPETALTCPRASPNIPYGALARTLPVMLRYNIPVNGHSPSVINQTPSISDPPP